MPLIDIQVQDRKDPTKQVTLKRYVIDEKAEPTAVIFGKFSPWTGPNGHGRLITEAKKKFKNVMVVSPLRTKTEKKGKYGANIFSPEQRGEIVKRATKEKFLNVKATIPVRMFTELLNEGITRPVFLIGGDRKKEFGKVFINYNKKNKGVRDPNNKKFGMGEMMVVKRNETSGTKIRKALVDNDMDTFIKMTGYDVSMWRYMRDMLKKNKVVKEAETWL